MRATGMLMKILNPEGTYEPQSLYDESLLKTALSKLTLKDLKNKGEEIFSLFLQLNPTGWDDLKSCFADLYRIFTFFLKEEGMGILKSLEFRKGFMRLSDNISLPCALTQSVVLAVMKHLGLKGLHIKETRCKADGFKFCEYQVVWISSNV